MRAPGTRHTRWVSAATVLLVGIVLAGCAPRNPAIASLEPVEFPAPVAAEPGLELELGDAVQVEQASAGETYLLGVAVVAIVEGEPWIWKNFQNSDELLDFTPYFVIIQRQWLSADEKYDISLYPVLSDGSPGYLMETDAMGAINPATCDDLSLGLPRLADPLQRYDCMLTAAPFGMSVAGVFYDGTFPRESGNVDPTDYLESPVSWWSQ